jgi:hypothetical protein
MPRLCGALLALWSPALPYARFSTEGSVEGRVLDPSGAAVSGARVVAVGGWASSRDSDGMRCEKGRDT